MTETEFLQHVRRDLVDQEHRVRAARVFARNVIAVMYEDSEESVDVYFDGTAFTRVRSWSAMWWVVDDRVGAYRTEPSEDTFSSGLHGDEDALIIAIFNDIFEEAKDALVPTGCLRPEQWYRTPLPLEASLQ